MNRCLLLVIWLVCCLAGIVSAVWMLCCIAVNSPRGWRIAVAFDELNNVALGGDRETISSRCWRYRADPEYAMYVNLINELAQDPAHCRLAFEAEQHRRKTDYEATQ